MRLYSINSFHKLLNIFIQQFLNNIDLFVCFIDLIHYKQGPKEKVTDFVGRFKILHAQISHHVLDTNHIQHKFIANL